MIRDCIDIIKVGQVISYNIPSFSTITVKLTHVVSSVWNNKADRVDHFDIYMNSNLDTDVPCTIEVQESCFIPVSKFLSCILYLGCKYIYRLCTHGCINDDNVFFLLFCFTLMEACRWFIILLQIT